MTTNEHITHNLKTYLDAPNPEYAFLLSGNWGVGKSFFLADFISTYTKNNKSKNIITISLFGFKSTSSIDEEIFKGLHPILGHKVTKLAGNILKGALKLGLKVDLTEDKESKKSVNIDFNLDKIVPLNSSPKKQDHEVILAFDDFERTDIPLKELLGYINHLVEISKVKVILVADETKLPSHDGTDKIGNALYRDFKEKIIGKTFSVQHNIAEVLNLFLKGYKSKILTQHQEVIKRIHTCSEYNNLRLLKQTIADFNNFSREVEPKYLSNTEFTALLIALFFSFSLEIKRKCLSVEEFMKEIKNTTEHNKKYNIHNVILYSHDLWSEILFNANCSDVNEATATLDFFKPPVQATTAKEDVPAWKKLLHYNELEQAEFEALIKNIKENFFSEDKKDLSNFFRELDTLLYFINIKLIEDTGETIKSRARAILPTILKLANNEQAIQNFTENHDRSGYSFFNRQDPFVKELSTMVISKKNEIITYENESKLKSFSKSFSDALQAKDQRAIEDLLLDTYKFKPLFNIISPQFFSEMILTCENKWLNHVIFLLRTRYFTADTLNNHPPAYFMTSELEFWQKTKDILQKRVESLQGSKIKQHILQETALPLIDNIIKRLQ